MENLDIRGRSCCMNSNLGILLLKLREMYTLCLGRITLMSAQFNDSSANFVPEKRYIELETI